MDEAAAMPNSNESTGLSKLDIVKHSLRTVIETLKENDSLSIVTFTGTASTQMPPLLMNESNKKIATEAVDRMTPKNMTNLWDGCSLAWNWREKIKAPPIQQSFF